MLPDRSETVLSSSTDVGFPIYLSFPRVGTGSPAVKLLASTVKLVKITIKLSVLCHGPRLTISDLGVAPLRRLLVLEPSSRQNKEFKPPGPGGHDHLGRLRKPVLTGGPHDNTSRRSWQVCRFGANHLTVNPQMIHPSNLLGPIRGSWSRIKNRNSRDVDSPREVQSSLTCRSASRDTSAC